MISVRDNTSLANNEFFFLNYGNSSIELKQFSEKEWILNKIVFDFDSDVVKKLTKGNLIDQSIINYEFEYNDKLLNNEIKKITNNTSDFKFI